MLSITSGIDVVDMLSTFPWWRWLLKLKLRCWIWITSGIDVVDMSSTFPWCRWCHRLPEVNIIHPFYFPWCRWCHRPLMVSSPPGGAIWFIHFTFLKRGAIWVIHSTSLKTVLDVVATLVDKEGDENPFEGRMRNPFGGGFDFADFLDPAREDDEVRYAGCEGRDSAKWGVKRASGVALLCELRCNDTAL